MITFNFVAYDRNFDIHINPRHPQWRETRYIKMNVQGLKVWQPIRYLQGVTHDLASHLDWRFKSRRSVIDVLDRGIPRGDLSVLMSLRRPQSSRSPHLARGLFQAFSNPTTTITKNIPRIVRHSPRSFKDEKSWLHWPMGLSVKNWNQILAVCISIEWRLQDCDRFWDQASYKL